jgi:hypothetical protein
MKDLYALIDEYVALEPLMRGKAVLQHEIRDAERVLNCVFDPLYKGIIARYGGLMLGSTPLFGLCPVPVMDEHLFSVVSVTQYFRAHGWPLGDAGYVISMDLAGNPVWIKADGSLVLHDHDLGDQVFVSGNLEDYLREKLAKN